MIKSKKYYLTTRYRFRIWRALIERMRVAASAWFHGSKKPSPFWSIFIIYNCTASCPYCIQNYSFINGRKDSPLLGTLGAEDWLRINDIRNKPECLVIQGGEPLLYKDLHIVLEGLNTFKQIQVLTNLTVDVTEIVRKVSSIRSHKVLFECSFHEEAIDFEIFVNRAILLKQAGLLSSVRMVDIDSKNTLKFIARFADYGLSLVPLYHLGFQKGKLSVYSNEEASNLFRKPPILCNVSQVLFSPNGDIYNCCTKLYWADRASSFGNIVTGFELPNGYYVCHDYGFCNPCQIGYMDVQELSA
jgi:organic radical activating enzyme